MTDDWKAIRDEALRENPETRKAYEAAGPRFALASKMIGLRAELGLTQKELAERAGMTQPEIARLESGRVVPKFDTVIRIMESVGGTVEFKAKKGKKLIRV